MGLESIDERVGGFGVKSRGRGLKLLVAGLIEFRTGNEGLEEPESRDVISLERDILAARSGEDAGGVVGSPAIALLFSENFAEEGSLGTRVGTDDKRMRVVVDISGAGVGCKSEE